MKKYYHASFPVLTVLLSALLIANVLHAQTFCYPDGNVIVYSNYDGGFLNINVDEDIPNLKIGITTYEKCEIAISGQYAGNVTQVIYAGYNGSNDHCNPTPPTTSISGAPNATTSVLLYPPVTWSNPNGYYYVICNYSCDSATEQGGCNTPDQIVHYYLTEFGGSLYYHYTQYGCWQGTYDVSDAGNCCIGASILEPQFSINASFSTINDTLCIKDSLLFFNNSFNSFPGATYYTWDFGDGSPTEVAVNPSHIYATPGNYTVTLIASNSDGSALDTASIELTLINCFTSLNHAFVSSGIRFLSNPVSSTCCLIMESRTTADAAFRLYDLLGNPVIEDIIPEAVKEWCVSKPMDQLPNGLYYAIVSIDGESHGSKIVLQH